MTDSTEDAGSSATATRRDRFKQLRAFCEAVRVGSISGAARTLESSQPVVSKQVQTLEQELGVALFRRSGARIAPTRAGTNLRRIALPLVEGLARLPERFEEHHHGVDFDVLRIGAGEVSGGYVLPAMVSRFRARWPRTRVEVRAGTGAERLAWLRGFELDIALIATDDVPDDIEFHRLGQANAVVATPEGHPLARCERVAIEALARYPMVAPQAGRHVRHIQDTVLRLHGVHPRIVLEVEGWGSMLNHVAAGVGIALVPDLCVGPYEPVRTVRLEHPYAMRTYGVAVRRDRLAALAARRFVEVAVSGAQDADDAR